MEGYYESLEPSEKLSHLKSALPATWTVKTIKNWDEAQILANFKDFEEELDQRLKSIILRTKLNVKNKTNYVKPVQDYKEISREQVKAECSISELIYFDSHFSNNRKSSRIYEIENDEYLTSNAEEHNMNTENPTEIVEKLIKRNESVHKALSKYGSNIWDIIDDNPRPKFGFIDWPYLILEFYSESGNRPIYNEKTGKTIEVPVLRKILVRIDFENEIVEIQANKRAREKDLEDVKEKIEVLFSGEIDLDSEMDIDDAFIKYMENEENVPEYQNTKYANHEGRANSRWSADDDIHRDLEYEEIKDRPHIDKNIEYGLPGLSSINIGFSKDENTIQIFRDTLTPPERRVVVRFIMENYHDYQRAN